MLNQDVIAHAAKSAFEFNVAMRLNPRGHIVPESPVAFQDVLRAA